MAETNNELLVLLSTCIYSHYHSEYRKCLFRARGFPKFKALGTCTAVLLSVPLFHSEREPK